MDAYKCVQLNLGEGRKMLGYVGGCFVIGCRFEGLWLDLVLFGQLVMACFEIHVKPFGDFFDLHRSHGMC